LVSGPRAVRTATKGPGDGRGENAHREAAWPILNHILRVLPGGGGKALRQLALDREVSTFDLSAVNPAQTEMDMFKSKASKNDTEVAPNVAEVVRSEVAQNTLEQHSVVEPAAPRAEPTTHAGTRSCIGSGMVIVGNIECNGPAQVFGRIQGELRASDLLIGDGAQVEGSVIAQNLTVCGQVKGTIRAVRVKLQNGGAVEGDIFHRSLSIDENSQFEGSSRRVENPMDAPSVGANGPPEKEIRSSVLAPYLQRETSATTDWSEGTVEPKH
jgi:cytoskeletal protein CcmA (bactofilin family)